MPFLLKDIVLNVGLNTFLPLTSFFRISLSINWSVEDHKHKPPFFERSKFYL